MYFERGGLFDTIFLLIVNTKMCKRNSQSSHTDSHSRFLNDKNGVRSSTAFDVLYD